MITVCQAFLAYSFCTEASDREHPAVSLATRLTFAGSAFNASRKPGALLDDGAVGRNLQLEAMRLVQ